MTIFFFPKAGIFSILTFTSISKINKKYLAHALVALCGLLQRGHGLGQQWCDWSSMILRPDDIRICSSCLFDGCSCWFLS